MRYRRGDLSALDVDVEASRHPRQRFCHKSIMLGGQAVQRIPFGFQPLPFRMPGSQLSRLRILSARRAARS